MSTNKSQPFVFKSQHFGLNTIICLLCAVMLVLSACQPAGEATQQSLPTLAILPSFEPSEEPTLVPTDTETTAPTTEPIETDTVQAAATTTTHPTNTPKPTTSPTLIPANTEVPTSVPTFPSPVFSTFTPLPPGTLPPPGTPQQIADVVISRQAFQDVVNTKIGDYSTMQQAHIAFAPGGIRATLTALGGQAFITGEVFISIQVSNGVATFSPTEITVNAAEPPDAYVEVVNGDFFTMIVEALDSILKERLGSQQDLENIVISGDNMLITLLVPK